MSLPTEELTLRSSLEAAAPASARVSVVTPSLNPGARLGRCLASVSGQGYPGLEHVVVDGGSSDGTVGRLEAADGIR